jgi:ABC-type hemin transport system substrate-binding protein
MTLAGCQYLRRSLRFDDRGIPRNLCGPERTGSGFQICLLMLLALLATLWACDSHRSPPAPADSPRIVALSPALAVMLQALGRESQIVGRHASDLVLNPRVPVCGDQNQFDFEMIASVCPTHVLTQWGARLLPERLAALAQREGWILRDCTILSLDDIERELIELDRLLSGSPEGSPQGRAAVEHLRHSLRPRDDLKEVGRILLLGSLNPLAALGPGSCHHDVLMRIGALPAIATGGAWQILSLEDVRRIMPDVIVLIDPRSPSSSPARGHAHVLAGSEALARLGPIAGLDVPAVRSDRVIVIDDPLSLLPSTNMATFADQLGDTLERWR